VGLILDSSLLIAGERQGSRTWEILERVQGLQGETVAALSVVTVIELSHGIYRAKTDADRIRRQDFVDEFCNSVAVYPVTLEVAKLAGRIHGQQMAQGISIDFQDPVIGATALHLGYGIATRNVKHFRMIRGLNVMQL
jgi:tRNA(fMet)-specific endonuclease VapC